MSAPSKAQVLALYKLLFREAKKFPHYNFRSYAVRRLKDSFVETKDLKDVTERQRLYEFGVENLQIIRRQVIAQHLYTSEKLVIENKKD